MKRWHEDDSTCNEDSGNEVSDKNSGAVDLPETEQNAENDGGEDSGEISYENTDETMDEVLDVSVLSESGLSRSSPWRYKCRLRGVLTANPIDNMNILIAFNKKSEVDPKLSSEIAKLEHPGNMTIWQYTYRAKKVEGIFSKIQSTDAKVKLMTFWLDQLLSHSVVEAIFNSFDVLLPSKFVPRAYSVSQVAAEPSTKYLVCSSRSPVEVQRNSINFLINLANACNLSSSHYGDPCILADTTSCSVEFARKVLVAIAAGEVENFLELRRPRIDAIKCSDWPSLIKKFVLLPENSRSVPGKQQVSVRYGVHLPKYLLLRSRDLIAFDFKQQYPNCEFSTSTIKREFPQNAVTPTGRDIERNRCPIHANVRRVVKRINREIREDSSNIATIPQSCRDLATSAMCQLPTISSTQPTSWRIECVTNQCKDCPGLQVALPENLLRKSITFSMWESKKVKITKTDKSNKTTTVEKHVFSLYPHTITVEEAMEKLKVLVKNLKWHIYTAHGQWSAHDVQRSCLDVNSIITVEDYQMNIEVVYTENPTSLAYSTNKKTVALFPICVEFVNSKGELCKGAIAFLSEDNVHGQNV